MLLVNEIWFIANILTVIFVIVYPLILAIIARRYLHVGWRYFGYGVLIFLLFQVVTRIPLVTWLQRVLAPQLAASQALLLTWSLALALTAGLFEEIGRYVAFRWFMRHEEKTWSKGVMYGIGHGGLESMLLVGGLRILQLYNIVFNSLTGLRLLNSAQRIAAEHQLAQINAAPAWIPLLVAWERLWTVPIHIGLSIIVLQVFRRHDILWLWLAVLLHAFVDSTALLVPRWLGTGPTTSLIIEGTIMVYGIAALWITWQLRNQEDIQGGIPSSRSDTPDNFSSNAVSPHNGE